MFVPCEQRPLRRRTFFRAVLRTRAQFHHRDEDRPHRKSPSSSTSRICAMGLTSSIRDGDKRSAVATYVKATIYISPYALIGSSSPALPTTQPGPTKSLHPQSLGPKLPGGWGAGRPRSRVCAAGSAEIRPTEPGRACPAKGVRYHRVHHRLVVSPEDRH